MMAAREPVKDGSGRTEGSLDMETGTTDERKVERDGVVERARLGCEGEPRVMVTCVLLGVCILALLRGGVLRAVEGG